MHVNRYGEDWRYMVPPDGNGKPGKKPVTITGDPIVCYIVGGTCYAEVGM